MKTINLNVAGMQEKNADGSSRQGLINRFLWDGQDVIIDTSNDQLGVFITRKQRGGEVRLQVGFLDSENAKKLTDSVLSGEKIKAYAIQKTYDKESKSFSFEIEVRIFASGEGGMIPRLPLEYASSDEKLTALINMVQHQNQAIDTIKNCVIFFVVIVGLALVIEFFAAIIKL